jgi:hypothetical protein
MVSMLASFAVDPGFKPRLGQIKDYKFGICCFSSKRNNWLARNQDNVSDRGDMSIRGLFFSVR